MRCDVRRRGVGGHEHKIENALCGGGCERIGKTIWPISIV
jgi:hypothetical protein